MQKFVTPRDNIFLSFGIKPGFMFTELIPDYYRIDTTLKVPEVKICNDSPLPVRKKFKHTWFSPTAY